MQAKHPFFSILTCALFVATDVVAIVTVSLTSLLMRYGVDALVNDHFYVTFWPFLPLFICVYLSLGLYPGVLVAPPEEIKKTFWGASLVFLSVGAFTFVGQHQLVLSRFTFFTTWIGIVIAVPLARCFIRYLLAKKPWWGYPAIIFGDKDVGMLIIRNLQRKPQLGLKPVVFFVDEDEDELPDRLLDVPALPLNDFEPLRSRFDWGYAIVAMPQADKKRLMHLVDELVDRFKKIIIVPNIVAQSSIWASTVDFRGILGLEVRQNLLDPGRLIVKRILDLSVAVLATLITLPVMLLIALAIRLETPGTPVYTHRRIGLDGKTIRIYKFRTMVTNADEVLRQHLDENDALRQEWDMTHKLKSDPRITRVGAILRKFSLDELPQLWNIFRGELSLVGPRPIVEEEIPKYSDAYRIYKKVRPGITGLWQVSGRNNIPYEERVQLDLYYIRNWSLWLDIYILIRTIPVVLLAKGAY